MSSIVVEGDDDDEWSHVAASRDYNSGVLKSPGPLVLLRVHDVDGDVIYDLFQSQH